MKQSSSKRTMTLMVIFVLSAGLFYTLMTLFTHQSPWDWSRAHFVFSLVFGLVNVFIAKWLLASSPSKE